VRGASVREALDSALVALNASHLDTPRLDAEVLLAHAMGTDRTRLFLDPDAPVEGEAVRAFRDAIRRRSVLREPVAYITGTKNFRRLDLRVDRRVLVPRPETELLVEWALEALPRGARVVDVGTGSGAIALALKDERPDLDVVGTDSSAQALEVARANALRLGLEVGWAHGDLLAGVRADAVVSNPPYVEQGAALAPELGHEPGEALFAGPGGLEVYERLVPAATGCGARWLCLEVGEGQAAAVRGLLPAGWDSAVRRDLAGIERAVAAWPA
jgi:release factor glutamine methyltransferase